MRQLLHRISLRTSPTLLRLAKQSVRQPRYWAGLREARRGYASHGTTYSHRYLFVAGLPKSGTSWVEAMLAEYSGYCLVAHPEITLFDYAHEGTHRFEMPHDFFSRLGDALCVIKIHCHGSPNNVEVLGSSSIPYCVLYRDLRDAAVSHVFYVKRTPWHPEYPKYRALDVRAGLRHFAGTLLPEWRDWIDSWRINRDPGNSLLLRYEDILADTRAAMLQIARLYGLPDDPIDRIVEANSFEAVKQRGSFFRKGATGDWRNHFDAELESLFRDVIGEALIRWGYEKDLNWADDRQDLARAS